MKVRLSPRRTPFPALLASLLAALLLSACGTPRVVTPGLGGPSQMLFAAGDIADCRHVAAMESGAERTARLVETLLARYPDGRVLTLGDHTYPVGGPAEFSDCFHPTWGRFKERILPVPGNHEYYTAGAPGYYGYFAAQAGPAGKGYYTTTLGSWRLIALNTALRGPAFAEQLDWLRQQLKQHSEACTLAYFHHPAFSSGGHGSNAFMLPLWKLLVEGGVDLALAAHDHHYESLGPMDAAGRPDPAGLPGMIVGTGGAMLSPLWLPLPATLARDNAVHGVLQLELRAGAWSWRFLPAAPSHFADQGHGLCR